MNARNPDLRGANLHMAILEGIGYEGEHDRNMTPARFDGADLTGATWFDGRVCGEGSAGVCK